MKKVGIVGAKQSRDFSQPKLTIGLDLGERSSWYCMLDEAGAIVLEQKLGTSPKAMKKVFGTIPSSRIALDAAEHGGRIEADQQKSGDLPSIHRIGNHGLAQTQVFFLPLNRRLQAGWNSCVRVSFDPVSTNLGSFLAVLPVKDNEISVLLRHVAINTVASGLMIRLRKSIRSRFVAAQTTLRES
jgi:hypothetical protein